jgi:hypothetical protein
MRSIFVFCAALLNVVLLLALAVAVSGMQECTEKCQATTDPVCVDQKTLANPCEATCEGYQPPFTKGACKPEVIVEECECGSEMQPVCVLSTKTEYDNPCFARCAGETDWQDGQCPWRGCEDDCPRFLDPVCQDGVEHQNACLAICAGAYKFEPHPCDKRR